MKNLIKGLGAFIVMAVILVGIPAALLVMAPNPFPTGEQWTQIFTLTPDYGAVILTEKILPCLAWIAWAMFAIPIFIELVAGITRRPTRKSIPIFRGQQKLAAVLVAALLTTFAGGVEAHAETVAPVNVTSISQSTSAPAADVHESVSSLEVAPAVGERVEHVVTSEDTLFGIAEKYLGDGWRYPQVFQENRDLISDPDLIIDGDVLTITLDAPGAPTPDPTPIIHTVTEADTLAGIAEKYLGDAARVPDVVAHNPSLAAGQLAVGKQLTIIVSAPGVYVAHQQPVEEPVILPEAPPESSTSVTEVAEPAAPVIVESVAPPVQSTPAPIDQAETVEESGEVAIDDDVDVDVAPILMTAGGIGGLLAAGLLSALGLRRLTQRQKRRRGERIAMPTGASEAVELELRMVEDPLGVEDLDTTLRLIQTWAEESGEPLPGLQAVRLIDDEIALYLTEPASLPAPFISAAEDNTAWIIQQGIDAEAPKSAVSPYPALVTVGTDVAGGCLLLDLELIGSLNITGDLETARGMLNAISVELATNPWAEQVQVTLVGMPEGLAADLDRFRIQHVDDVSSLVKNLKADMETRREALESNHVTNVLVARTRANQEESWAPHLILLGETPAPELLAELTTLVDEVPRLGIATVAAGDDLLAAATITAADPMSAQYQASGDPLAIGFRPQLLQGRELELIEELFATTRQASQPLAGIPATIELNLPAEPAPDATTEPQLADLLPVEHEEERSTASVSDAVEPEAVSAIVEPEAVSAIVEPEAVSAIVEPEAVSAIVEPEAVSAIVEPEAVWKAPYIRVFGVVEVENTAKKLPGRGAELMTFLSLQQESVSGSVVQKALWADSTNRDNNHTRQLAKHVRAALGHDPEGFELLPEARNTGFRLHESVQGDWQDFKRLVGDDPATASTDDLKQALRLVRGAPLSGREKRRGWWGWTAPFEEEITAAVLDAADELAQRAWELGHLSDARLAGRAARTVDSYNEFGWRVEIETAIRAHDTEAFNNLVDSLYHDIVTDDIDLDPETAALIDRGTRELAALA